MIALSQTLEQWGEVWAAALWRASWQGAIALIAAWAVARWCRFVSPRVVCWLWRLACLKLLVALVWAQPVPLHVLPAPVDVPVVVETAPRPVASPLTVEPSIQATELIEPEQPMMQARRGLSTCAILAPLWLAGVLGSLGLMWKQWRTIRQLVASAAPDETGGSNEVLRCEAARLGMRRPPRLLVSAHVESPLLAGVWRPTIVLPAQAEKRFDAAELRLMLAHELAHQRRHDLVWNWLPAIVRALFFFHPFVWLMLRRWSVAQEAACDELLLQKGLVRPAEYGRLLLKLAGRETPRHRPTLAAAGVLGAYRNLEQRILAMTRVRSFSRRRLLLAAGAFLLLTVVSLIPSRLAPQLTLAETPTDEKPAAKPSDALPGQIYVWVDLDLRSEAEWPHNYRGLIEIDPNSGDWRKISPLGQFYRISPDGKRIAFSGPKPRWSRDGTQTYVSDVSIADLADPKPVKLVEKASLRTWSPDGRHLLYHMHDGSEG